MPRIGICCPVDGQLIDDNECLTCRVGTPRADTHCHYSYEMLKGMMDSSGRASAHISTTMLTTLCPRRVWLEKHENYHVSPVHMFPAWRGTMGHLMTEQHPAPGVFYEHRFETHTDINDEIFRVTGQIDKLDIANKRIEDFKTKADSKLKNLKEPEEAHIWQLNIYRFLVKHGWPQKEFKHGRKLIKIGKPAGIEINELKLTYWSMNEPKALHAPIYHEDDVRAFIHEKVTGLVSGCPPIPDHLNPLKDKICTEWCAVRNQCLEKDLGF